MKFGTIIGVTQVVWVEWKYSPSYFHRLNSYSLCLGLSICNERNRKYIENRKCVFVINLIICCSQVSGCYRKLHVRLFQNQLLYIIIPPTTKISGRKRERSGVWSTRDVAGIFHKIIKVDFANMQGPPVLSGTLAGSYSVFLKEFCNMYLYVWRQTCEYVYDRQSL